MLGDTKTIRPGERITAAALQQMREAATSGRPVFPRNVTGYRTTSAVTFFDVKPTGTRWVYAVGLTTDGFVLVKDALPLESDWTSGKRWTVAPGNNAIERVRPAPGYGIQHFIFHIIDEAAPKSSDLACRIEGGYVVPDQRMQLVAPASVESLCGPCPTGATSAVNEQTGATVTMRRKPKCGDCGQKIKAKMKAQHDAQINAQLGLD